MEKLCTKCKEVKNTSYFPIMTRNKDGYGSWCKLCKNVYYQQNKANYSERRKEYYSKNRTKLIEQASNWNKNNATSRKKILDTYEKRHESTAKEYRRKYYCANKEKIISRVKEYNKNNPDQVKKIHREYHKKRCKIDPTYKLIRAIYSRIHSALRSKNQSKNTKSFTLVGKTGVELMDYLETLFKPGMTRNNQGRRSDEWHLDHIKPIAAFDKNDPNWLFEAFHYSNLQPLWSKENLKKNSVYNGVLYRSKVISF